MEVHAHSPAGVESWDNLKPIVDVSFLLNFSRIKRPNMRRYTSSARRKDANLLAEMQRRWGEVAYNKLKESELLTTRREFDTSKFTLSNVYNALVQQGFQVPQEISSMFTRYRQMGNAPSDLLQTQTDARLFRTKTVAQLSPINAMNFCMNRAVQMMTQSIGGFRRNIRLLLKYWASRPYLLRDAQTKMERKITRGMWAALRRVQSWNRAGMLDQTEWNGNKDNALQFFWLACQYYKRAVQRNNVMPVATIQHPQADFETTIQLPNPNRVRFNKLLYANVGQSVLEDNQIGFIFNRDAPEGFRNPYADLYVANGENAERDQEVAKNFKSYGEVFENDEKPNVYVTGYLGYKWDTIGGYNDAMPFYPYTAARRMIEGLDAPFEREPDDFPNDTIDADTMERAAQEAQYMSVHGSPPGERDDLRFSLTTLPRAVALNEAVRWSTPLGSIGNSLQVKGDQRVNIAKPPAEWWARSPYFIEIPRLADNMPQVDARSYLVKALPAYGHIVDRAQNGPNKPVRAVFKPALAQDNVHVDNNVVFDSLPGLQLPEVNNFDGMMTQLFRYTAQQQTNAFDDRGMRFQYGKPIDTDFVQFDLREAVVDDDVEAEDGADEEEERASGADTGVVETIAERVKRRRRGLVTGMHRAVTMPYPHVNAHMPTDPELAQFVTDGNGPAVPYIQNLMWDATLNAHADTRLLSVVLDPTHYRAHLHANLDFYQRPSERVLRHFVHKMGW